MTPPTKEQIDAAKAWNNGEETKEQVMILRTYADHSIVGNVVSILHAALEAAEADVARLDWLQDHPECNVFKIATSFSSPWEYYAVTYDQAGDALRQTPYFSTAREAIDAARKEAAS